MVNKGSVMIKTNGRNLEWMGMGMGLTMLIAMVGRADPGAQLRPPAVPLVAHDPYFSIWSAADRLTDAPTTHWTGTPHPLNSTINIDGEAFRLMGVEPADASALPQLDLRVLPTRTLYRFGNEKVEVVLTFLTPALPSDIDVLSRPLTYLTWNVRSVDGQPHTVQIDVNMGHQLAIRDPHEEVVWDRPQVDGLIVSRVGSKKQRVLGRSGDMITIDWGYAYLAASDDARTQLTGDGAVRFDLGSVGAETAACRVMLAYDDLESILYFDQPLLPYWRRNGWEAADLLTAAAREYNDLAKRCAEFDVALMEDLTQAGGAKYAALCALAYRQTLAGNKVAADANGKPMLFPKENNSNGCISTVDVMFPQAPFFLLFSPALTKAMLVPILDYASSTKWPYRYAPHDLGTYPWASGQIYGMGNADDGIRMPLEESGNMLIMMAALTKSEGNADLAKKYWSLLTMWVDYCVAEGLDPKNQLCSADMFGHMPRAANLALKAIIGIGGYAQMCEALGKTDDANKYMTIARDYAAKWQELAKGEGRTLLGYGQPDTWAMKHNLIWDRMLGTDVFPESVGDSEIAWYLKVQNEFGLPVDNRTDTSLIDWALWSITLARDPVDFNALFDPIFRYANETSSRVPLADWFNTKTGDRAGFRARPVVGGILVKMMADSALWSKWAALGEQVSGAWAPLPVSGFGNPKEIVPTAKDQPVMWRYTLETPADDWMNSDFDDSAWLEGPAGFGNPSTPGAVVRTEWKTPNIWLRRAMTLPDGNIDDVRLIAHFDEDAIVYLNGVHAADLAGFTWEYKQIKIQPEGVRALKSGENLMAVHCRQTTGGQYIDVGLAIDDGTPPPNVTDRLPVIKPLFDYPIRDPYICLGPDGNYYLTGTTGAPDWWHVNEGVRIWKSSNLVTWEPLGLVWSFEKDGTWQDVRDGKRALWAPEIHFINGTYWIPYSMNYGGTGLLKSESGKAEGPYVDVTKDSPLTDQIDPSLFQEDDGTVYFIFQNGKIARMNEDMTGLVETPKLLPPTNHPHVGFEGATIFKHDGRYHLICADFRGAGNASPYDSMIASSDSLFGPYGERYIAIPQAGHNMIFKDKEGQLWSTIFGHNKLTGSPIIERAGILKVEVGEDHRIRPVVD